MRTGPSCGAERTAANRARSFSRARQLAALPPCPQVPSPCRLVLTKGRKWRHPPPHLTLGKSQGHPEPSSNAPSVPGPPNTAAPPPQRPSAPRQRLGTQTHMSPCPRWDCGPLILRVRVCMQQAHTHRCSLVKTRCPPVAQGLVTPRRGPFPGAGWRGGTLLPSITAG